MLSELYSTMLASTFLNNKTQFQFEYPFHMGTYSLHTGIELNFLKILSCSFMCVKFDLLLWEKNIHYKCLTVGCLGKCLFKGYEGSEQLGYYIMRNFVFH
jgi:hypothetical protein